MTKDATHPATQHWTWDEPAPIGWLLVDEETMGEPDLAVALCSDIDGLFTDSSGTARATLLGCRPLPPLRRALDALGQGAGNPGGAVHRRQIDATLYMIDDAGAARPVLGGRLRGAVASERPSALGGGGLVDVTFDAPIEGPLPSGARPIWDLWRAGGPAEPGLWAPYDSDLRYQWIMAARLLHRYGRPDQPAGATYHLDGRYITDEDGFYCALGEAVNGPGGYFGAGADALHDCVRGGFGAAWPFRLVWHDAAVARTHLRQPIAVPQDGAEADGDREERQPPDFDQLLRWLADDGIDVVLE